MAIIDQGAVVDRETASRPTPRRHLPLLIGIALAALMAALFAWRFHSGYLYESNDTTNLYLRLAHGSGYGLLVVFLFLPLPVARTLRACLKSGLRIRRHVAARRIQRWHQWLGAILVVLAMLHGISFLLYYQTLRVPFTEQLLGTQPDIVRAMHTTMYEAVSEDEFIADVHRWIREGRSEEVFETQVRPLLKEDCTKCHNPDSTMTYAMPQMPLSEYEEVLKWTAAGWQSKQFRVNLTGLIGLLLFAAIGLLTLPWVRRRRYRWFQGSHRLLYLLICLIPLHIPNQWAWWLLPIGLLLAELILSRFGFTHKNVQAVVTPRPCGTMEMKLQHALVGDKGYVKLRIPSISPHQWHPFTVAYYDPERTEVTLFIRVLGFWTGQLQQTAMANNGKMLADVRGPYPSTTSLAQDADELLLIAGGIGITPFMGLLEDFASDDQRQRRIRLIWVFREAACHTWLIPLLEQLRRSRHLDLQCRFYLDGEERQWPQHLIEAQEENGNHRYLIGRPGWEQEFHRDLWRNADRQPHIFLCAPPPLAKSVHRVCRQKGLVFHEEGF